MNHRKYAITVYSTLWTNRSFSLYYFKIQNNLQKLLENGDWSSSHAVPRTSLQVGAPGVFWWSAPCWPEELAGGQPRLPLEVSGSGKGGMGNNSGSCAIKVDLDSLRKFSVLLPEENRPVSGGLRRARRTLGWLWFGRLLWLCQQTYSTPAFSVLPISLFSHVSTPTLASLQRKGYIMCQQTRCSPLKNLPWLFRRAKKKKQLWWTNLLQTSSIWVLGFFPFLMLCSGLSYVCILTSQLRIGKKIKQSWLNYPILCFVLFLSLILNKINSHPPQGKNLWDLRLKY